jgi:hypothetical protein
MPDLRSRSVNRTWILQANPKLYDIDAALQAEPVNFWRIPQYSEEVKPGDLALIWRAGKQASFVGWGVFLTEPRHFNLSDVRDPFWKTNVPPRPGENYAALRIWHASEIPKADVSDVLPKHRIVTAPMGTVFPLDSNEVAALQPLLTLHEYDLGRPVDVEFKPPPVVPGAELTPGEAVPRVTAAKITPALFLLSLSPERPTEITIEGDALRLLLVERAAVATLDEGYDTLKKRFGRATGARNSSPFGR